MADETDLRRDVARAAQARALLDDPMLAEAFTRLADAYQKLWLDSVPSDQVTREKTYLALRMLPVVRRNLETIMMAGSVPAKQLLNLENDRAAQKRNG